MILRSALLVLLGVVPALAFAQNAVMPAREPLSDEVEAAASAMEDDLEVMSLLAATAALIRERTGSFPSTAFDLLGAPEADRTGARALVLSSLTLTPSVSAVEVAYGRTPRADDPTERGATFTLAPDATAGGYSARFVLSHTADADFGGRRLLVAREGALEVRRASGRLCIDLGRVAALRTRQDWRDAAPYLGPREALSVAFDTPGGRRVGATTLPAASD